MKLKQAIFKKKKNKGPKCLTNAILLGPVKFVAGRTGADICSIQILTAMAASSIIVKAFVDICER